METLFRYLRYDVDAAVAAHLWESVRVALRMGHPERLQLSTNTAEIEVDLLSGKVSLWSYVEEPPQIESDVFQFIAFLTFIVQVEQSFVHYFRDCLSEATVALGASNVRKVVWASGSPAIAHMFGLFELIFVLKSMKKVETYCCNVFSDNIPKNCLEVSLFDLDEKYTPPEWMIHLPAQRERVRDNTEETIAHIALTEACYHRLFLVRGNQILSALEQMIAAGGELR